MNKIKINMLLQTNMPAGQGVGSATTEQNKLLIEGANDIFDIKINSLGDSDITHHHTINPNHYYQMITTKGVNVTSVHFLPHTVDGSIKLPKAMFNIFKKYIVKYYRDSDYLVVVNPILKKS